MLVRSTPLLQSWSSTALVFDLPGILASNCFSLICPYLRSLPRERTLSTKWYLNNYCAINYYLSFLSCNGKLSLCLSTSFHPLHQPSEKTKNVKRDSCCIWTLLAMNPPLHLRSLVLLTQWTMIESHSGCSLVRTTSFCWIWSCRGDVSFLCCAFFLLFMLILLPNIVSVAIYTVRYTSWPS